MIFKKKMPKRCPQRHFLCPGPSNAVVRRLRCDVCGREVRDEDVSVSCGRCMFDACKTCVAEYPADFAFRARLATLEVLGLPLLPIYERTPHVASVLFRDVGMAAVFWAYQEWANTDEYRGMLKQEAERLDSVARDAGLVAREARMKYVVAEAEATEERQAQKYRV